MYVFGHFGGKGGFNFKHFMPNQPFGDFRIKEITDLIFLYAIAEEKNGLTGYRLQNYFGIPLSNIYRSLDKLVSDDLLKSEDEIINGRAQKLYKVTEKGLTRLNELKDEWASKVSFLQRIVPPCSPFPFSKKHESDEEFTSRIKKVRNREEALSFLKFYLDSFENRINSMEASINAMKTAKNKIIDAVDVVKNIDDFSSDFFAEKISEIYENIESDIKSCVAHTKRKK